MFLVIAKFRKSFKNVTRLFFPWTFLLGTQVWNMFWFFYFEIIFIGTLKGILFEICIM
jgi:hypothetical protein